MANPIDAAAALVNKWVGIGLGVFVLVLIIGALWDSRETLAESGNNVIETSCIANAKINGINLEIENLTQELIDDLPTETWEQAKVKAILQQTYDGQSISEDEYLTLLEDLNRWHKLKFNLYDLDRFCSLIEKP